jgi:hypothetical protein
MRFIGPYVSSHPRHYRQQSDYTLCMALDEKKGWYFHPYELERLGQNAHFWKFMIPSTERRKVLKQLNDYNLNAFSLFGSEESLLQTMWLREHSFRTKLE